MRMRRSGHLFTFAFVLAAATALSACTTTETGVSQAAPVAAATPAPAVAAAQPAPAATPPQAAAGPMTREKASANCWMKYEKEARSLSLDQRVSLVEKCTTEKLKTAG